MSVKPTTASVSLQTSVCFTSDCCCCSRAGGMLHLCVVVSPPSTEVDNAAVEQLYSEEAVSFAAVMFRPSDKYFLLLLDG